MRLMACLIALAIVCVPLHAQDYPARTVRLVAAAAPGGNPDVLARMLAANVAAHIRTGKLRVLCIGMELRENGTEHYARFAREDIERYAAAVKAAGIRQD